MKKIIISLVFLFSCLWVVSCSQKTTWTPLFNGENLDNWDKFVGGPYAGHEALAATATADNVFSVVPLEGSNVIRISGDVKGALATKESFENYHVKVVYKWGEHVIQSRNSGLLYHSYGPMGAALGTWMASLECQMMQNNPGDTFFIGENVECTTRASLVNDNYAYDPQAEKLPFGKQYNRRSIKKKENAEKPQGEWNTMELYCLGQTSVHVVNGVTVMVNEELRVAEPQGVRPLTSGKLQLQSEGSELFIKEVSITPITELPSFVTL